MVLIPEPRGRNQPEVSGEIGLESTHSTIMAPPPTERFSFRHETKRVWRSLHSRLSHSSRPSSPSLDVPPSSGDLVDHPPRPLLSSTPHANLPLEHEVDISGTETTSGSLLQVTNPLPEANNPRKIISTHHSTTDDGK